MVLNVAFAKRSRWNNRNPVGRISGTRHPAMGAARCLGGRGSVGRIRRSRHPAIVSAYCTGGRIPFTIRSEVSLTSYAVNGTREAAALPLSIPAAPRGNRCCALRSPPACLTAAGSTRLAHPYGDSLPVSVRLCPPSMASRPCHSRFGSPISAGVNTIAAISQIKTTLVSL
ncbi:UNVERIFIED_ORG: hypothetical protein QE398_001716 [Atlantibacter sp. SORGH_AS 304]|nr:hypothetical protein [Atlantibacter sp. SORGH_AS_0304]